MLVQSERDSEELNTIFDHSELIFLLGEELKKPLTVIQSLASNQTSPQRDIVVEARRALRTIDNILLYQRLVKDQTSMNFEPIHVGSTLAESQYSMRGLSSSFGCDTEIVVQSGMSPVDADRRVLKAAIESLWQAVLSMTAQPSPLIWRVQNRNHEARITISNSQIDISSISTRQQGRSRQPFAGLAGPATDLMTSLGLLQMLGAKVRKYYNGNESGFAIHLNYNPQLSLI